jgi:hypothetical protein
VMDMAFLLIAASARGGVAGRTMPAAADGSPFLSRQGSFRGWGRAAPA